MSKNNIYLTVKFTNKNELKWGKATGNFSDVFLSWTRIMSVLSG
jgi:hypothetical protein